MIDIKDPIGVRGECEILIERGDTNKVERYGNTNLITDEGWEHLLSTDDSNVVYIHVSSEDITATATSTAQAIFGDEANYSGFYHTESSNDVTFTTKYSNPELVSTTKSADGSKIIERYKYSCTYEKGEIQGVLKTVAVCNRATSWSKWHIREVTSKLISIARMKDNNGQDISPVITDIDRLTVNYYYTIEIPIVDFTVTGIQLTEAATVTTHDLRIFTRSTNWLTTSNNAVHFGLVYFRKYSSWFNQHTRNGAHTDLTSIDTTHWRYQDSYYVQADNEIIPGFNTQYRVGAWNTSVVRDGNSFTVTTFLPTGESNFSTGISGIDVQLGRSLLTVCFSPNIPKTNLDEFSISVKWTFARL